MEYNDLYEVLRKEKYSEQLQQISKVFIIDAAEYFEERKKDFNMAGIDFSDSVLRARKQFENSKAIFKELILRRKKKILDLVFVAAETGIMKKDFSNMLDFEKDLFEELVESIERGDKKLKDLMDGRKVEEVKSKMIVINEDVGEMISMNGEVVGPFKKGDIANLEKEVAELLVSGGKAGFVDE